MNKRGDSFDLLYFIPKMIFLIVVMVLVIYLVSLFVTNSLDVREAQAKVFANKIYYSPNGISYYDSELGKTIPGTIDPKKITNITLENMMNYNSNSFVSGKVTLYDFSLNTIASAKYKDDVYDVWSKMAALKATGEGGITRKSFMTYVNYVDEKSTIQKGMLSVEVLLPGS